MLYIDKKYVNLVSGSLQKFKWKKDSLATCRCFKCGDSKKNKSKTRGYFFENKGHYVYKCHNCGFSCNLYSVLESVSPSLCNIAHHLSLLGVKTELLTVIGEDSDGD